MILLAAYGLMSSLAWIARRQWRWSLGLAGAVAALVLLVQAQAVATAVSMRPYEYAYFSPVIGGFSGAVDRYELEYWGACDKEAAEWLDDYLSGSQG
jgi:hypothetical protein